MDLEAIKQVLDSGAGVALKEYLTAKLNQLKNIDSLSEKDTPAQQAVEVKAQKRAYVKLREILEDIMTFSGVKKKKDPRDNYEVGVDDEEEEPKK